MRPTATPPAILSSALSLFGRARGADVHDVVPGPSPERSDPALVLQILRDLVDRLPNARRISRPRRS
ncbi:MAG TPA: hypothetical protein VLA90_01245 [Actinomycetota bacterium]|nr:hypothetical protein [Actinomycetota bacterium]